jgi:lambda repressor-like predicted transcriptional regulator
MESSPPRLKNRLVAPPAKLGHRGLATDCNGGSLRSVNDQRQTRAPQLTPNHERHLEIKARLQRAGSSFAQVARTLGVSHTTVTTVSMGFRTSRRVQSEIASVLGVEPSELWPERAQPKDGEEMPLPVAKEKALSCTTAKRLHPSEEAFPVIL